MNLDATLFASVVSGRHSVYIYSLLDPTADAVVVGASTGTSGTLDGQLNCPGLACFVNRNGADTLLICDAYNHRIVEVTASGVFLRAIAVTKGSLPWGIAYCGASDVIAVSLCNSHEVVLLQYESGAVKPEVTIGSGMGSSDGQLSRPHGVTFTADGRHILVADWGNDRVSKFSADSGSFIAHAVTNGISYPRDVLQFGDGSIAVAQGFSGSSSVVCDGVDGGLVHNIIIPSASECAFIVSLTYSPMLNGAVVKTVDGKVFLLREAWMSSTRCVWLSALTIA